MKLAGLFDPFDTLAKDKFFKTYWNKAPIKIVGASDKFSALPSRKLLPAMCTGKLEDNFWKQTTNTSANAIIADKNGDIMQLNNVPISMYSQLYNAGYGLCFQDISASDQELQELVEDTKTLSPFRSDISVTCYLTPPNSNGVLHFDHQHIFLMQREGTKFWRISETPAISNPIQNFVYQNPDQAYLDAMRKKGYAISIPSRCGFQDIKLSAGDLLYLPPGYYHLQHTQEDHSFHYTLTLDTVSFWNLFLSSIQLELLKHSSTYNSDIRMLESGGREKFLAEQLTALKNNINALEVSDMEITYKNSLF